MMKYLLFVGPPPIMTEHGPVIMEAAHPRMTSGASIFSDTTFPMRIDAYKAIDITPGGPDMSVSDVPSTLPYPLLAKQRAQMAPLPVPKSNSLTSAVKAGSASLFSTLGRKTSISRGRSGPSGTQSATEGGPRKLVSPRAPSRSGSLTAGMISNPTPPANLPPLAPSIPGGPRAPRVKRASTLIAPSNVYPPISAPPLASQASSSQGSAASAESAPQMSLTMSISLSTMPGVPNGPRPQRSNSPPGVPLTRTPSFPGPATNSGASKMRPTLSFRPSTSGGIASPSSSFQPSTIDKSSPQFTKNLNQLCDVMPHADRDILAGYLIRANGEVSC